MEPTERAHRVVEQLTLYQGAGCSGNVLYDSCSVALESAGTPTGTVTTIVQADLDAGHYAKGAIHYSR